MRGHTSHGHDTRGQRRRRRARSSLIVSPGYLSNFERLFPGATIIDRTVTFAPAPIPDILSFFSPGARFEPGDGELSIVSDEPGTIAGTLHTATFRELVEAMGGDRVTYEGFGTTPPAMPVIGPNEYQCARCRKILPKGWSEEEAQAELKREFPGIEPPDCVIVCDDCYKLTMSEQ